MSHLSIHTESREPPKLSPLVEADNVLADLEAATRLLRTFFCTRLDREQGLTFEELYDLDRTLQVALVGARARMEEIYREARAEAGTPPLEETLPGLRKREESGSNETEVP